MGIISHDELTYTHQIWNEQLGFATYADLKIGASITTNSVGKLARVLEDGSLWEILNNDPLKFVLREGENVTREDMEIHVDPVSGDDDIGNGSAEYPFKSFHCLDNLPKLRHTFKVRPKAGTYTYFPELLDLDVYGNGRLVIDASGESYPTIAGTFTISAVTGVGDVGPEGKALATEIKVSGAPNWTADAFYPRYIHVLDGNWAGYVLPIFKNDSDTLTVGPDWYSFNIGDSFNIVDCPVTIETPNRVVIRENWIYASGPRYAPLAESPYGLGLAFCGLKIKSNGVQATYNGFQIKNTSGILQFCTLINEGLTASSSFVLDCVNSQLNGFVIPGTFFDNPFLSDYRANGFHQSHGDYAVPQISGGTLDLSLTGSVIFSVMLRGRISVERSYGCAGLNGVFYGIVGSIYSDMPGQTIYHLYFDQNGFNSYGITLNNGGDSYLQALYFNKCSIPLVILRGSAVWFNWIKGNISLIQDDYALHISGSSKVEVDGSEVTLLGQVGAIDFTFSDTQHAAWPPVGPPALTDGVGSYVFRSR